MGSPDLEAALRDVAFCVVDLETTGGSPATSRVTEIGAVKVRGGELLGELATLVDPGTPIPGPIVALTGITDHMVAGHPPMEAVLPSFVEFAAGTVLVAHNARFDTGFLGAALRRLDYPPLSAPVVCTAALARRLVGDEAPNCRLATLARLLRARTVPTHRALADARATVDVLHALLERAATFGVATLADLLDFAKVSNPPVFREKRHLADGLPAAPGVYRFVAEGGEVLYVGKATDLRARVRRYFGGDDRRRVADLVRSTARIDHERCPTPIEAEVRELRAIHAERPRFNRKSRLPRHPVYVKLTSERFPRLSIARVRRDDGGLYLGPLPTRAAAQRVVDALHDAAPVRRCTDRISPDAPFPACVLAELARCPAPCEGAVSPRAYAEAIAPAAGALVGDAAGALARLAARMRRLAAAERFEEAAEVRRRVEALTDALARSRRTAAVARVRGLAAARRLPDGAVEVVVARRGRLVASARTTVAAAERLARELLATAADPPQVALLTEAAERDLVARWLEQSGVFALHADGALAWPVAGGRALAQVTGRVNRSYDAETADRADEARPS